MAIWGLLYLTQFSISPDRFLVTGRFDFLMMELIEIETTNPPSYLFTKKTPLFSEG